LIEIEELAKVEAEQGIVTGKMVEDGFYLTTRLCVLIFLDVLGRNLVHKAAWIMFFIRGKIRREHERKYTSGH